MLKIIKLFSKNQKKYFYLLVCLICIVSLMEMINLAIIVPILNSFLEIENSSKENNLLGFINLFKPNENSIQIFLIIFLIFFILKTLFSIFVSWKYHSFTFNFIQNLSFNLYSKYLSQKYKIYSSKNSSELLRNVLKEMDLFYLHLQSLIQIILECIILIGILIFLLYLITVPTLTVIVMAFFFAGIYYFFVKKNLKTWGENRQSLEEDRIKFMQEGFNCIKEINFFKRHNFFLDRFREKNNEFYKIYINFNFLNSLPRYIFELFTIVLIAIVFFFLLTDGKNNEEIIKILALFFAASFRTIPCIYRIFSSLQNLKYTDPSIKVLLHDLENIKEKTNLKIPEKINFNKKAVLTIKEFSYSLENKFKLNNINIEIQKNQKIGLIGKSGSGKSTVLDIFSGINSGKNIELNVDGKKLNESQFLEWQNIIGLIPQNISLINDSFKQNILFGLKNDKISEQYILNIIKISNLNKLLSRLPKGIEHNISEKGTNLSGGEIQRIGIARALIFNPQILIFDEATSALDTFSENEILEDINSLPNKTIIMISHRMNTLKFCDKIYLIDNGKIIDEGPFFKFKDKY